MFVHNFFELFVASFLVACDLGSNELERLIHLELYSIPLKFFEVLFYRLNNLLPTSLNVKLKLQRLKFLIKLFCHLVVSSLVSLARLVDGEIVLREGIHEFHQLVQGADLELLLVDLKATPIKPMKVDLPLGRLSE